MNIKIKKNITLLKDGNLERLMEIINNRTKPTILKNSSDLDIFILWVIRLLDRFTPYIEALENEIINREFDLEEIKKELGTTPGINNQKRVLNNLIKRVFKLDEYYESINKDEKDKFTRVSNRILELTADY